MAKSADETVTSAITVIPLSEIKAVLKGRLTAKNGTIHLVTDPGLWAYSAVAAVALPGIEQRARTIRVRLKMRFGRIGMGWEMADGTGWTARSAVQTVRTPQEVKLVVPAGTIGGKLIFDNWTAGGKPAEVVIQNIAIDG